MNIFFGISASSGIGFGKAFVIPEPVKRTIIKNAISPDDVSHQWQRFISAKEKVSASIDSHLKEINSQETIDKIQQELFETYSLMLTDPVFIDDVKKYLETNLLNIEYCLNFKTEEYADRLRNSGNEYLAERGQDICDIFGRVLNELMGIHPFNMNNIPDGSVIVANSMNPSDTIVLSKKKIAGLALTEGGVSSHVAILARNYAIPAVFALEKITQNATTGEDIIVDAKNAEVIVSPDEETMVEYHGKLKEEEQHRKALLLFRNKPAMTKDGTILKILANIGTPDEAKIAAEEGADGIGLFRTEFLFMSEMGPDPSTVQRSVSEEKQFLAYKSVLETMGSKPVTIRTLDAGGDKLINSKEIAVLEEKNPLMGLRAIRLSLRYPQMFKTQLRALYRASIYGNLKIMLPLITSPAQVIQAKQLIKQVMAELDSENVPYNKDVPVGIMIETAAAAITADCLAKQADFFSIGTNDLTQYTIGVDRENSTVAPLYDEFHLAVLRMIYNTIDAAQEHHIEVSVCGEMASRIDSAMVLAGMGIRTLSMSPAEICSIKEMLSTITMTELQSISSKKLNEI